LISQKFYDRKKIMKPKIHYDKKSNILSIRLSKKKSVDSDMKDNIVIDYDEKGEIVNIEIMKVSLGEFIGARKFTSLRELIKV